MFRVRTNHWFTTGLVGLGLITGCSHNPSRPTVMAQAKPVAAGTPVYVYPVPAAPAPAVVYVQSAQPAVAYAQPQPVLTPVAAVTAPVAPATPAVTTASYQVAAAGADAAPPALKEAAPKLPRADATAPRKSFVDITAAPSFGHAPDYAWLSGQVEYSRLANGWRLRYASVDETDPHGGSVTLTGDASLGQLKDGEHIRVSGHFSDRDDRATAPAYHVDSFEVITPTN